MAPIAEAYFPPLDKCFNRSQEIWSWELCLNSLLGLEEAENDSLGRFLSDPQTQSILYRPLNPHPEPNADTKATFDTKTSAVNTTTTASDSYDLQDIKSDALWLSKRTTTDEVSCLRVVVLEWQTRSASELLKSTKRATRSSNNGTSFPSQDQRTSKDLEHTDHLGRRRRLVEILLREKTQILKCAELIFARWICEQDISWRSKPKNLPWLAEITKGMALQWTLGSTTKGKEKGLVQKDADFILNAMDGLQKRLENLQGAKDWSELESLQDDMETIQDVCLAEEIVHILELVQDIVLTRASVAHAEVALAWFKLMADCAFFEEFRLPYPGFENTYALPIQSLAALISLSILNVASSLDVLEEHASISASDVEQSPSMPFILNRSVTHEIDNTLIALAPLTGASPSVMAWSIITQAIKESAFEIRETRETRRSLQAASHYDGGGDSSDTDGNDYAPSRRRTSAGSDISQGQTILEDIHDSIAYHKDMAEDPVTYLSENASEGNKVFEVISNLTIQYLKPYRYEHDGILSRKIRVKMLDILRACANYFEYQPGIVMATLTVITGAQSYWDLIDSAPEQIAYDLSKMLRTDELLRLRILLVAISRFPYETMPVLQLFGALSRQEYDTLMREQDTFTFMVPPEFTGYRNIREDENMNYVELTDDYAFDFSKPPGVKGTNLSIVAANEYGAADSILSISAGTSGEVLSGGKPLIVAWNHTYSGIHYVGKILLAASSVPISNLPTGSPISIDNVAEVIGLLKTSLFAITKLESHDAEHHAVQLLAEASDAVDRNDDIVSVIFRIFENALYREAMPTDNGEHLPLLVECVQFTHALLAIQPDRVWPFLGRSGLLDMTEGGGRLQAIISTYEIVSGRYDFLLSCIRLFDALVEDCVKKAVQRRSASKTVVRFGLTGGYGAGISQQTMEKVLASLQRTLLDVFRSFAEWKYADVNDRADIGVWSCTVFDKLLKYTYSTDTQICSHLTAPCLPATQMLLNNFIASDDAARAIDPLIANMSLGLRMSSTSIRTNLDAKHALSVLRSLQVLLSLIKTGIKIRDITSLRKYLLTRVDVFAALYVAKIEFRQPIAITLSLLLPSSVHQEISMPSILTQLGNASSAYFLRSLSVIDKPIQDDVLNASIWQLLGALLITGQQWFAHFILTGRPPDRRALAKADEPKAVSINSMLTVALDALSHIDQLEPDRALVMLDFVALAMDNWPQTLQQIHQHRSFAKALPQHAVAMELDAERRGPIRIGTICKVKVFSRILDILAMYTHWTLQENVPKFATEALKHLYDLSSNVTITPDYNHSLHANLRQNFQAKFSGCDLVDFQASDIARSRQNLAYYDLALADKMLSYEPAWQGKNGKGFREEMRRASLNLALVDAQISAFKSWRSFMTELSNSQQETEKFQIVISETAVRCLNANINDNLPSIYKEDTLTPRAELAFSLVQTLNTGKSNVKETQQILPAAWRAIRSHGEDLGAALSEDDTDYHRLLIRILYLAIHLHTFPPTEEPKPQSSFKQSISQAPPTNMSIRIALEILSSLVSKGFRSLTGLLHESPDKVTSADFFILIAILNICLQIPGLQHNTEHLSRAFSDTQTPRCAAALLSWSHKLAITTGGDPIYGEAAVQLLLELSTVPALAETLAVETVLSHILDASLIQEFQNQAFGPFDNPPRMYLIWSRGFLPLVLNLLSGVGPQIAAEVASALNTFPEQLARASQAFRSSPKPITKSSRVDTTGLITLAVAQETHCLALIVSILRQFKDAGASAGVTPSDIEDVAWKSSQVKEDVEDWLGRGGALRDRVVPSNAKEEEWMRTKATKQGVAESKLEEKVLRELKGAIGVLSE